MDNRQINLQLCEKKEFEIAMRLAVNEHKTIGYRIEKGILVLYWANSPKAQILPYEMDVLEITNFAWGWLEKNQPDTKKPDFDGDAVKGFRIYNESWGHVFDEWQAYIAIQPIWALYGK
jgi:hypothetical protein